MRQFPFASILSILILTGCGEVAPPVAARLAALDAASVDPAQVRLVAVMPEGLDPLPETARLTFQAERSGQSRAGEFALQETARPPKLPLPAGAHARTYALGAPEAERLRAMQTEIAALPADGQTDVRIGMALGGCRQGAGPAERAEAAIFVQLSPGDGFEPLLGPAPLIDMIGAEALAALPACPPAE